MDNVGGLLLPETLYTPAAPDGNVYAWLNPGGALSQDTVPITPGEKYTLTMLVGAPLGSLAPAYELVIYSYYSEKYFKAFRELAVLDGTATPGTWTPLTLTYTANAYDIGLIGVSIRNYSTEPGTQILADKFQLVDPVGPPVPEPTTLLLFGSGWIGIGLWARKFRKI